VRVPLPLTFLAVIALAAACGGSPATSTVGPTATAAGPTATTAGTTTPTATTGGAGGDASQISCNDGVVGSDVTIVNFAFQPATIAADADDTVHWTNTSGTTHTVTFDNGKDCGSVDPSGGSLTVLFLAPGTYPYHCSIHKTMTGTVTVNG
jgi:plastocyanin